MAGKATAAAARRYMKLGWCVLPVGRGSKRPLVAWQALQLALPTADEVAGWFDRWPDANVGIVTGAVSGLVVIDVDVGHGGEESLERWQAAHGALPQTVEAATGGGGRHLYFSHPGGEVRNRVAVAPGVDVRGDGGYVVAPPSLHPSGKLYRWQAGRGPGEIPLAVMPGWLVAELTGGPQGRAGHSLAYWRQLLKDGVTEGRRNTTVASLAGHLLWHGVDVRVIAELLLCWNRVRCRPPLSDDEVARTVASVSHTHERQRGPVSSMPVGSQGESAGRR